MEAGGRRPDPIPLTILTGFLGAGKTTLLNALLRDPALADTVVIVNEFGEVGLDHHLIETAADGIVLLAAGCLCCTVRGDLVSTLEDLLRRRDNGRIPSFRRVVIETTGLADPVPVIGATLHHPYLSLRYAVAGVVTAVDAAAGLATLARHEEARRQVAVADRLVVTKGDLAAPGAAEALEARLRELNPGAAILRASHGEVPAEAVLGGGLFGPDGKIADVAEWLRAEGGRPLHDHDHDHGHAHDVSRHGERIRSVVLRAERPVGEAALDAFLGILRETLGPKLLRLKGLVALARDPERPLVIHGVQHILHVPTQLPAWPGDERGTRIVVIAEDAAPDTIRGLWGAFTGEVALDRPDAAALADNPLAPATLTR